MKRKKDSWAQAALENMVLRNLAKSFNTVTDVTRVKLTVVFFLQSL